MRTLILTTIIIISGNFLCAQNNQDHNKTRPSNNININLIGDASIISINYEKHLFITQNILLTTKLGLGYNIATNFCNDYDCFSQVNFITIPHHLTVNFGKESHFLEFGLGGTKLINSKASHPYLIYPIFGYRYLPLVSNDLNFSFYFQYVFHNLEENDFYMFPFGLSIGYSF